MSYTDLGVVYFWDWLRVFTPNFAIPFFTGFPFFMMDFNLVGTFDRLLVITILTDATSGVANVT